MKCTHEIEWDTCIWCRTPSHYDQGDHVYKTWLLCGEHDLRTPVAEVEACIWCYLANLAATLAATGSNESQAPGTPPSGEGAS